MFALYMYSLDLEVNQHDLYTYKYDREDPDFETCSEIIHTCKLNLFPHRY